MLLALPMLGFWEIVLILAVALIVFGPSKLPQLGSSVGKMLRGFKKELKSLEKDDEDEEPIAVESAKRDAKRADADEIDVTPKAKQPSTPG